MKHLRAWLSQPTRMGAGLLLVFCLLYGWLVQDIASLPGRHNQVFDAATMPGFLSILGVVLATTLLLFPGTAAPVQLRQLRWLRLAAFLLLMSGYALILRPLGFLLATLVFLSLSFMLLGEQRWWRVLLVATSISVLFWLLMSWGLQVYLPPWPGGDY